jgi:hypothetical protein
MPDDPMPKDLPEKVGEAIDNAMEWNPDTKRWEPKK